MYSGGSDYPQLPRIPHWVIDFDAVFIMISYFLFSRAYYCMVIRLSTLGGHDEYVAQHSFPLKIEFPQQADKEKMVSLCSTG